MTQQLTELELDQHLRRTLRAVAATVEAEARATPRPRRRPRRRLMVGLGAIAVAAPLAAGAVIGFGPEYVDQIPPDNVIVAGSVDGDRYWMVESFHTDACDQPTPGVELVVEQSNIIGREWNTQGVSYGETPASGCGQDVSDALADPSLSYSGGSFVGDTFLLLYAVHPDVTAVRVTTDSATQEVEVHRLDGAGYAVFEVPPETTQYTVELLIDGDVVPGSTQTRAVPEPLP